MSKDTQIFFEKLNNWKDNFEIILNADKLSGEVKEISQAIISEDLDVLFGVWGSVLSFSELKFRHPLNQSVTTKAVQSNRIGMVNYVLFVDASYSHPWLMAQCVSMIDVIITVEEIFLISKFESHTVFSTLDKVESFFKVTDVNKLYESALGVGFVLSQNRPYHHFYDQLKYLYQVSDSAMIHPASSFFKPNKYDVVEEKFLENSIFLFPTLIGNNQLDNRSLQVKKINEYMEDVVYQEAMECFHEVVGELPYKYDLVIWLGVTGQKRSWLQQTEGYLAIIKQLKKIFTSIKVYIDGLTALDGKSISNNDDENIFVQLHSALENERGVKLFSLIGEDYRTKICHCDTVDAFIANAGTGCMVPLRFNKKPGVLHSNNELFTFPDDYCDTVKRTSKSMTIDFSVDGNRRKDFLSYHIPWQHIYNLTAEVLNQVKGANIQPQKVPPVEEVAKEYEESEIAKQKYLMAFRSIENRVKPVHKSPDILREVALSFEQVGDIKTALTVMQKALELRPNGPFIKRKITEYKQLLSNVQK